MTNIKDLKEKDRLVQNLMIKSCTKGVTQKGASYLNLVLQDKTGTIDGKLWDCKPTDEENAIAGRVARVTFEVLEYNHALQLRVNKIEAIDQNTISLSDYLISASMDEASMRQKVKELIASINNDVYRILVQGMFNRLEDAYYRYPAASRIHHGYLGGLAEHSLSMSDLVEEIAKRYSFLDRDLLVSGALIHDMGKTAELGGLVSSEYTTEGRLIGHISICHGWLMEIASENGLDDREETVLLRHMVLSHHGKYEYGSPVLPELPEAEVLTLIDNLDARMNTLKTAMDTVKPGNWTTKLFSLDNRQFYKAKNKGDQSL